MYPMEGRGRLCGMQPMVAIPTTRATTSNGMRRVCVNIAANDSTYPPIRRRRRRFINTITMPTPSMMYPSPYEHVLWNCHDGYGLDDDANQRTGRLDSGQEWLNLTEVMTNNDIRTSSQATLCSGSSRPPSRYSMYENKSVTRQTIDELKSIVEVLEKNVQQEEHIKPETQSEPKKDDETSQKSQLHLLAHLMRETNEKLDSYILNQAEQHSAIMSSSPLMQMNLLGKLKGGRHRRSLPVLPLIVQTLAPPVSTSALPQLPAPPNPAAGVIEGNESCTSRQRLHRPSPPRYRRRRRPLRSAYIHLENRSCSTHDLDALPRVLLARTPAGSGLVGNETITQNLRDCGTTMWCPMNCCRQHFCGVTKNCPAPPLLEEKEKVLTPVPYPMQPSPRTIESTIEYDEPPPLPKTPPPKGQIEKEEVYHVASRSYDFLMEGSSSCSSSQDLSYSYMNGGQEELHDWYSNMDVMEQYYRERKPEVQTRSKQLQTEFESTASATSTSDIHEIIATTDKAVSTTTLQDEIAKPIRIVRQCKSSSLKPQRGKKVIQKANSSANARRSQVKVKFEKRTTPGVKPKMKTVGTNPILMSSVMQMPTLQQCRTQKCKSFGKKLKRKTSEKQETEESAWYRVTSGSFHLPPNKSYPTCWS